ncbi:MAG: glycerophosphodiester phosphodiesterase family protein [Pseudomonadota bacterium]
MHRAFDLLAMDYAHRGLWSPDGPPENSMAAFLEAASNGFGIELDVQLSSDGIPIVFHDPMLDRMTEATGPVWSQSAEDLTTIRLRGSSETIPTLKAVMDLMPAHVQILVELKTSQADPHAYVIAVAKACETARAGVAVKSFTPTLNQALRDLDVGDARGLLVNPRAIAGEDPFRDRIASLEPMGANFLSIRHEDLPALDGVDCPIAVWTVDSLEVAERAKAAGAALIFEHINPALVAP